MHPRGGGGGFLAGPGGAVAYLSTAWGKEEEQALGMRVGSHRDQALAEVLIVLVAVRAWRPVWALRPCRLQVRSDSTAAIGAVRKMRSKIAAINAVVRELALTVATSPTGLCINLRHLLGARNAWADALSRLAEPGSGAVVPGPLRSLPRAELEVRGEGWWKAGGVKEGAPEGGSVMEEGEMDVDGAEECREGAGQGRAQSSL